MSLPEILIIAIIAVLFLGPDKLPEAMVQIAKFFKGLKKMANDAKSSFESEIKIAELKEDAAKYKQSLEQATNNVRKKLTFEELDEIKNSIKNSTQSLNQGINTIKDPINSIKNEILTPKQTLNPSSDANTPAGGRRMARMQEIQNMQDDKSPQNSGVSEQDKKVQNV